MRWLHNCCIRRSNLRCIWFVKPIVFEGAFRMSSLEGDGQNAIALVVGFEIKRIILQSWHNESQSGTVDQHRNYQKVVENDKFLRPNYLLCKSVQRRKLTSNETRKDQRSTLLTFFRPTITQLLLL